MLRPGRQRRVRRGRVASAAPCRDRPPPAGQRRRLGGRESCCPMIRLTHDAIDYHAVTERVRRHDCGAVVTFLGTVREMTDGRRTTALGYQAYPEMAQKKMAAIEKETRARWPVGEMVLVHRLGRLELGEISVAVAVSCPHRAQAFDA